MAVGSWRLEFGGDRYASPCGQYFRAKTTGQKGRGLVASTHASAPHWQQATDNCSYLRRQPRDRDCSSGDGRCDGDVCLSLEEVRINIHQRLVHRLISGRHTAVGDLADFQDASDEHTLSLLVRYVSQRIRSSLMPSIQTLLKPTVCLPLMRRCTRLPSAVLRRRALELEGRQVRWRRVPLAGGGADKHPSAASASSHKWEAYRRRRFGRFSRRERRAYFDPYVRNESGGRRTENRPNRHRPSGLA